MKIFITGATGFIGSKLCEYLGNRNEIYGLIRKHKYEPENIKPVQGDLNKSSYFKDIPQDTECIIYLAQSLKYRNFPSGSNDMLEVNVVAPLKLMQWAVENKMKRFIYASTANVYGNAISPFTEETIPEPNSFYGETKFTAEKLLRYYSDYINLDILRIFTVYGPNQKNMLVPNLIKLVEEGQTVHLASGVGPSLSPIYIEDIVKIIEILAFKQDYQKQKLRIVNVCSDQVMTLSQIVSEIEVILGTEAPREFTEEQPSYFSGSNSLLKSIAPDFKFTDFKVGLRKVIEKRNN